MTTNLQLNTLIEKTFFDQRKKWNYLQTGKYDTPEYLGAVAAEHVVNCCDYIGQKIINKPSELLNKCIILNYSRSDENDNGTHWVACLFPKSLTQRIIWFDSYGQKPDAEDVILGKKTLFKNFLDKWQSGWTYNKFDFQNLTTQTCGLWAALSIILYSSPFTTFKRNDYNILPIKKEWDKFTKIPSSQQRDKKIQKYFNIYTD